MAKLTTLFNRILMLVVFLLSCTRGAVTRIFPSYQPVQKAPTAKVFALAEAAWLELRTGADVVNQDRGESQGADGQRSKRSEEERSRPGDDAKGEAKDSEDKQEPSKSADSDGAKRGEDKKDASPSGDEKKKDATKPDQSKDEGPGGGDGDMGGTGG
jgi:hypothetical protein